jgi:hypothetical protein
MWLRIANMAHHVRRQNSKRLNPQRFLDRLDELRESLVVKNGKSNLSHNYGATNMDFNDTSPNTNNICLIAALYAGISNYSVTWGVTVGWPGMFRGS